MNPQPHRRAEHRLSDDFAADPELAESVRTILVYLPADVRERLMRHLVTRLGHARPTGGALIPALTDTIENALERWDREALTARERRLDDGDRGQQCEPACRSGPPAQAASGGLGADRLVLTTPRTGTASADRGAPTGRSAISGNIASDPTTSGSASVI